MRQRHSFGNTPIVYQNLPLDSPGPDPFASNPFIAQVLSDNHSPTRPTPPSPDATASLLVAAGLGGGAAVGPANSPTGSSNSTDAHASATSSGHHRFSRENENERWNSSVSSDPLITASDIKRRSKSTIGDTPPTPPPRSPLRLKHYVPVNQEQSAASLHDEDEDEVQRHDNRLNPHLTADLKRANTEARSMRDNVDYSRPILGVRKL